MRVFITASYGKDSLADIDMLKKFISDSGHIPFCFATDYPLMDDPHELMQSARSEIKSLDVLLYDATNPGTGRLIEVGIAFESNKKVVVIAKTRTEIKDTLKGVVFDIIHYDNLEELQIPINEVLSKISKSEAHA